MLSPIPMEGECNPADYARWFIGYMPVDSGNPQGAGMCDRLLPRLPDFSVPVLRLSAGELSVANPYMNGVCIAEEMPVSEEDGHETYTDADLHEALAELMMGSEPVPGGEIEPVLRAVARRAVAEWALTETERESARTQGVAGGRIRAMVSGWMVGETGKEPPLVGRVIGLQLFCKSPFGLMVSCGEIPAAAEEKIGIACEMGEAGDLGSIEAGVWIHGVDGVRHVLVAVVRGGADEAMVEDLNYLLRRIERRKAELGGKDHGWDVGIVSLLQEGLWIRSLLARDPAYEDRIDWGKNGKFI